jgi:ferric-chelate reductase (NADPH)
MNELTASEPEVERNTASTGKRKGLLEAAVQKMFMRPAHVFAVEDLGEQFRMVTLGGPALKKVEWTPGDKIQIQFGGWVQRTYTPVDWDSLLGRTRVLVYLHGDGPGAHWARALRPGDDCVLFGPRDSIDLTKLQSPAFVFGDETSFGLVVALNSIKPGPTQVQTALEISPSDDTLSTIKALGLDGVHICERHENSAHLAEVEAQARELLLVHPSATFVLTGKAASIQHLRQFLRRHGVASGQFQNKAYWAPGKKGMD